MTERNDKLERKFSTKSGISECISKPISPEVLLEMVNHFLMDDSKQTHEVSLYRTRL